MRAQYDFDKMKGQKNPYAKVLRQAVTIRLDKDVVVYFKLLSGETGMPYQNLINLYLRDCASHKKRLKMEWKV